MIASLRGILTHKSSDELIVEVGGVGYDVCFSPTGLHRLPEIGAEVFLHIYTNVREDSIDLYGFSERQEKEMFIVLTSVSGVGPKLAMNILSGLDPAALASAILTGDLGRFTKLPGVGRKTAERLCVELKDKVQFIPALDSGTVRSRSPRRGRSAGGRRDLRPGQPGLSSGQRAPGRGEGENCRVDGSTMRP